LLARSPSPSPSSPSSARPPLFDSHLLFTLDTRYLTLALAIDGPAIKQGYRFSPSTLTLVTLARPALLAVADALAAAVDGRRRGASASATLAPSSLAATRASGTRRPRRPRGPPAVHWKERKALSHRLVDAKSIGRDRFGRKTRRKTRVWFARSLVAAARATVCASGPLPTAAPGAGRPAGRGDTQTATR